jgi:hypothetical protein
MQDRICQIDENLLHRTAGPYIRVKSAVLTIVRPLPLYPQLQTSHFTALTVAMGHKPTWKLLNHLRGNEPNLLQV